MPKVQKIPTGRSLAIVPLTSSLVPQKGTAGTFTRNSVQYTTDFENILRPVYSGSAAFEGPRVVSNINKSSEGLPSYYSGVNLTKDPVTTYNYNGITLQRVYGNNFYTFLYENLSAGVIPLTIGKKYLYSCYIKGSTDNQLYLMRNLLLGTSNGHGAKLVNSTPRRIWGIAGATSTYKWDAGANPTVALGSGAEDWPSWIGQNNSPALDLQIGGMMIEEIDSTTKAAVVVIGDSTTAGSSGGYDASNSAEWTRWAEANLNVPFYNRGVGGNTTAQMVARWATDITPLKVNANYVIIQGGINDIAQSVALATIQANFQSMYNNAVTDGMTPVIATCTPFLNAETNDTMENERQALNTWIKTTFANVVDFDAVVRDPNNPRKLRSDIANWYGDGTHYGSAAKQALGEMVARAAFWSFIQPSEYIMTTTVPITQCFATKKDGSSIVSIKGYLSEPSATNSLLYCRDFTNAAWTKTNVTAALTATGIDGATNAASTLTASAINGTALQSITLAAAARSSSAYVKRRTGTGAVSMTRDGGTTWTDITSQLNTSTFTRVSILNTSVTNPSVGFKLAVSGDAIDVDFVQDEAGVVATSPILTTSATATRAATVASFPVTGNLPASGPFAIRLALTPKKSAAQYTTTEYLWSSWTDINNETSIFYDGSTLTFRKRIAGVNYDATKALSVVAGGTYYILARYSPNSGSDIFALGAKGTGNSNTTVPVLASTFQAGSSNNVGQFQGNITWLTDYANVGDAKAISLATP